MGLNLTFGKPLLPIAGEELGTSDGDRWDGVDVADLAQQGVE